MSEWLEMLNEVLVLHDAKYRQNDIQSIVMVIKQKHFEFGKEGSAIKEN